MNSKWMFALLPVIELKDVKSADRDEAEKAHKLANLKKEMSD